MLPPSGPMSRSHLRRDHLLGRPAAALIGHLSKAEQQRPGDLEVTIWAANKPERQLTCKAVYLPHGVDVRLLQDDDLRIAISTTGPLTVGYVGQ